MPPRCRSGASCLADVLRGAAAEEEQDVRRGSSISTEGPGEGGREKFFVRCLSGGEKTPRAQREDGGATDAERLSGHVPRPTWISFFEFLRRIDGNEEDKGALR